MISAPDLATEPVLAPRYKTWTDMGKRLGNITWFWPGWMPDGFLSMLVSESGEGKSNLLLRIAGCVTNGLPFPDGSPCNTRGLVLWAEAEGAQQLNFSRAKAWGIDTSKIITPFDDEFIELNLDITQHRDKLMIRSMDPDVALIVVDSLSGSTFKKENDTEAKSPVQFLARLARDTRKPIAISHHLNKGNVLGPKEISLSRVRGSSSLVQFARVVWAIDQPNGDTPDVRRLSQIKNNLDKYPAKIGFTIAETGLTFGPPPSAKEKLEYTATQQMAMDYLKDTPEGRGLRALAEELGKDHSNLSRALAPLIAAKILTINNDKKYIYTNTPLHQ